MQIIGNLVELLKQVLYLSSIFGCNNVMCLFFSGHLVSYPRNNDILSIRVLSIVSRRGRRVETALPQGAPCGYPGGGLPENERWIGKGANTCRGRNPYKHFLISS